MRPLLTLSISESSVGVGFEQVRQAQQQSLTIRATHLAPGTGIKSLSRRFHGLVDVRGVARGDPADGRAAAWIDDVDCLVRSALNEFSIDEEPVARA